MNEFASATSTVARKRTSRASAAAAVFQCPAFANEPVCCEPPVHGLDDVLLSGSDDEYYDDAEARIRRIEEQARLFLEGRRPLLLSATLRGPFGKETGWENPWRGGRSRGSRGSRGGKGLGTTPSLAALDDNNNNNNNNATIKPAEPKKRSASSDWLRRKNLKRMKPMDDDHRQTEAVSPTASRTGRVAAAAVGRAFKSPVSARSFSAPVEPRVENIPDCGRSPSVPSDLFSRHRLEDCQEMDDTLMPDQPASTDDDMIEDEEELADMASQQIAAEESQHAPEVRAKQSPTDQPLEHDPAEIHADETAAGCSADVAEAPAMPASAASGDERLATQFQSPWTRESQWQLPAPSSPPVIPSTTTTPTRLPSPSQNPWAEDSGPAPAMSSSQPNLPTSPCSPGQHQQDVGLPQFTTSEGGREREQEQEQEPFLPSLPLSIPPAARSSGTAPSTPDTKHSSLPTPDVSVSIKSFRRFRSPSPTPLPRRRNNKKGGLPSILKPARRKPGVSAGSVSAATVGRRVRFALTDDDDTEMQEGSNAAAEATAGDDDEEEEEEQDFIEAGLSGTSRGRKVTRNLRASTCTRPSSHRAASPPPPQDKALMASLPSEVEKFQGHFASVAGRASAAALSATKADADADTCTLQQKKKTFQQSSTVQDSSSNTGRKLADVSCREDNKENTQTAEEEGHVGQDGANAATAAADDDDDAESVVDDVQDVIDHLDDFLGMWDMDAELAQVRSGV